LNGFGTDSLCELRACLCVLRGFLSRLTTKGTKFFHKAHDEDTHPVLALPKRPFSLRKEREVAQRQGEVNLHRVLVLLRAISFCVVLYAVRVMAVRQSQCWNAYGLGTAVLRPMHVRRK